MVFRSLEEIIMALQCCRISCKQCIVVDEVQNDNSQHICAISRELFCDGVRIDADATGLQ